MDFRFPKSEKLKSRKLIDQLFVEGESIKKFPVRMLYFPVVEGSQHVAGFAVPKRNFKHAVIRNRIKRQMREAYRLQKQALETESGKKFALLFLYISKEKPQYDQLFSSMGSLLKNLKK